MVTGKRFLTAISALLLSATLGPATLGKQTPWDSHIAAGRDALRSGNYPEARQQLDAAMADTRLFQSKDPRLAETYLSLGELNLDEQNYGQAKQYYQRSLELQQQLGSADELKLADTLYGLATAAEMTGDRELAVILLKRVREIWSKQYGATSKQVGQLLKPLGIYATISGDFHTAEQCYRQLVTYEEQNAGSSSPQTGSALNLLSMTLSRTGNYTDSAPLAERAVQILAASPDYRSLYEQAADNLAFIDRQLGKPEPHLDLNDSPKQSPSSSPVRVAEHPPSASAPRASSAAVKAGAAERLAVNEPIASSPSFSKENLPPAKASPVVAMAPSATTATVKVTSQPVMRAPATSVRTSGDDFRPWEVNELATSNTNSSANSAPPAGSSGNSRTNWGTISYLANGRLITEQEYEAMLLANEAYELIRQEKYKMACDVLRRALGVCPDLPSAHTNLGLALAELGNTQEAIEQLKQAIALDPRKSAPWINLASSFQTEGDLHASVVTYDEFVKRFPAHPMTPKAKELVAHLQNELNEQTAVEHALGSATIASLNDYLAFASHPSAVRWPENQATLKVYIQRGDAVVGFKPEYEGFCRQAFADWTDASGGKVAFEFLKRPDGADIDWQWTNDSSKVKSLAEGGETNISSTAKQIQHASIMVLTANSSVDSPLSPNQVRAVCLHEIGHALGLVGHSPKPEDIMFCSMPAATTKPALSSRDAGTIKRLYTQGMAFNAAKAMRKG